MNTDPPDEQTADHGRLDPEALARGVGLIKVLAQIDARVKERHAARQGEGGGGGTS